MHLDFMRDSSKGFPLVENPESIKYMRIWHCKYKTFAGISIFKNLKELVIASFPDSSLEEISNISDLRHLKILHFPNISDLTPIEKLTKLESLSLSTLPTWDASGKLISVDSLRPLGILKRLKHLELFGVVPLNKSLKDLDLCESLETARFSKYPKDEVNRFYSAKKVENKFNPEGYFK